MVTPEEAAQAEAERRYLPLWVEPAGHGPEHYEALAQREAFVAGAEWAESRHREGNNIVDESHGTAQNG